MIGLSLLSDQAHRAFSSSAWTHNANTRVRKCGLPVRRGKDAYGNTMSFGLSLLLMSEYGGENTGYVGCYVAKQSCHIEGKGLTPFLSAWLLRAHDRTASACILISCNPRLHGYCRTQASLVARSSTCVRVDWINGDFKCSRTGI